MQYPQDDAGITNALPHFFSHDIFQFSDVASCLDSKKTSEKKCY
jgi:hypothetical protein